MRFLKKITSNSNFWPLLVVIFVGILAGKGLIGQGYFNMHDDLQMMRQLEMEKCFLTLQIPCRWIPDMGYGFGFPLFNFYPPLPYLIGEGVRLLGIPFVDTVKIVFILAFVTSGITMYFLGKEFFGRLGGVIASVFYVWAPYHSVDIYVRGALNEAWALVWFPLIFLTAYKLITAKGKKFGWIVGLGLSWAALLVSHNLMAMVFAPLFALWCLLWIVRKKGWRQIPNLIIAGILAFGLVAFFTIPVLVEQKYTHANTLIQGYYEYTAHFATVGQILFSRFWGYGASIWGPNDGMPFQVGHIHWILSIVILGLVAIRYLKTRKIDNLTLMILLLFAGGWFAAFMTHSRSTPIWQLFKTLNYVQFPWRFLTIVIFCFSFLAGSVPLLLPKKLGIYLGIILSAGLIIWNWNYFLPEHGHLGPLTDTQKFTGVAWELQQTAGIYDYLPIAAEIAPRGPQKSLAEVIDGKGDIISPKESTNWATFNANITSNYALVRINIFQFPNWRVFIDGTEAQIKMGKDEKIGRIYVNVPNGMHQVYARLYDTWSRTLGNIISLVTWVVLIALLILRKKKVAWLPSPLKKSFHIN